MILCLWLVASLSAGCLGSGLHPATVTSSVEAHGPLAHLALQSRYDLDSAPLDSKHLVPPYSVVPSGYHTVAQFQRPPLYHAGVYHQVPYRPLQLQYFHPTFVQHISQVPQQYPTVIQPPYQYPITSRPPQQVPSIPQPPQHEPTTNRPPQQFPTEPQFPQEPPQLFPSSPSPAPDGASNAEFDPSDTVVVENPDFDRFVKTNAPPKKDCNNQDSFEREFEEDVLTEVNSQNKKYLEQEKDVQNIISDFENLHLLRMFRTQSASKQPLQGSELRGDFQILLEPPKLDQVPQPADKKTLPFQISQETTASRDGNISVQSGNNVTSSFSSDRSSSPSTTGKELPTLFRSSFVSLQTDQNPTAGSQPRGDALPSVKTADHKELQETIRRLLELLTARGVLSESRTPCAEVEGHVDARRVFPVNHPAEGMAEPLHPHIALYQ